VPILVEEGIFMLNDFRDWWCGTGTHDGDIFKFFVSGCQRSVQHLRFGVEIAVLDHAMGGNVRRNSLCGGQFFFVLFQITHTLHLFII
jgi:hypothetical protein